MKLRAAKLNRTNRPTTSEVTVRVCNRIVLGSELETAGYTHLSISSDEGVCPFAEMWRTSGTSVGVTLFANENFYIGDAPSEGGGMWHSRGGSQVAGLTITSDLEFDIDIAGKIFETDWPPHTWGAWARLMMGEYLPSSTAEGGSWFLITSGGTGETGVRVKIVTDIDAYTCPAGEGCVEASSGRFKFADDMVGLRGAVRRSPEGTDTGGVLLTSYESIRLNLMIDGIGYPLIRIGNREWLRGISRDYDSELSVPSDVSEGEYEWSRESGKIVFSEIDIEKATPTAGGGGYDLAWLQAKVYCDGWTRSPRPTPFRSGQEIDVGGVIEREVLLPYPGVSGIGYYPDGTGDAFTGGGGVRPNGSGMVLGLSSSDGAFVKTNGRALETLEVVPYEDDFKSVLKLSVREAQLSLTGGKLNVRGAGVATFVDGCLMPSIWTDGPHIYSTRKEPFDYTEGEVFRFVLDGDLIEVVLSGGGLSAKAVVDLIENEAGRACALATGGLVKIYGSTSVQILSGGAQLGMLPYWRVDGGGGYLPDGGVEVTFYRSPANLTQDPGLGGDVVAYIDVDDEVLTDDVSGSPFVNLGVVRPREDLPGYDRNKHFSLTIGLREILLGNRTSDERVSVKYEENRLLWGEGVDFAGRKVQTATDLLNLSQNRVWWETLSGEAMAPSSGGWGLYLQDGGVNEEVTDYVEIGSGIAQLTEVIGRELLSGYSGVLDGDEFSDVDRDFTGTENCVIALKDGRVFVIDSIVDDHTVVLRGVSGLTGDRIQWSLREGFGINTYDPAIVADVQYVPFDHLKPEPFSIRLLTDVSETRVADISTALARGREVNIRFGLGHTDDEVGVSYLKQGLSEIDVTDVHFTESVEGGDAYFQLRVGPVSAYNTTIGNLHLVSSFTSGLTGDVIEVGVSGSGIEGEVNKGTEVDVLNPGQGFFYDQLFLDGLFEIDPSTGAIGGTGAHDVVYFVEELKLGLDKDARVSPMGGAVYLTEPMKPGQIVETSYYTAGTDGEKLNGDEITEYLPLLVRLETAVRVDARTYTFNPTSRTIDTRIDPQIWAGVDLQNYAGIKTAEVTGSTIVFYSDIPDDGTVVQINYGVLEAFGGEQTYQVSSPPVYRPPFKLAAGQSVFYLDGDRTDELSEGQLLLVGSFASYVESTLYTDDVTEVTLTNAPLGEAGSRAPGLDVGILRTDRAVRSLGGFLLTSLSMTYQPIAKGATAFTFFGDWTRYTKTGHLVEIGGVPFILSGSQLDEEGRYTTLTVQSPAPRNFNHDVDGVRVSVRPIYGPSSSSFSAPFGVLVNQPFDLALFPDGDGGVGRILTESYEYVLDSTGKSIQLQAPIMESLSAGAKLLLWCHSRRIASPMTVQGAVIYPTYGAKFLEGVLPSSDNGILGAVLKGKYTYFNPDTFYYTVQAESEFLADVLKLAAAKAPSSPSGGALSPFPGAVTSSTGTAVLGVRGEAQELQDYDDAARDFIVFYDTTIRAFEQVLETIDGQVIGDRDGKFKFFVGYAAGNNNPPPGYVNDLSGRLNPRLLWREIIQTWSDSDVYYDVTDPIYDPRTAYEPDPVNRPGETNGWTPTPDVLDEFLELQNAQVRNDMDDILLIEFGEPKGRLISIYPRVDVSGVFKQAWEPSVISRLFPERTKHFSRLLPGVGSEVDTDTGAILDPGVYTAGRKGLQVGRDPVGRTGKNGVTKTRGRSIGRICNPVLGNIDHIADVTAQPRRARARVWAYYPYGDAGLDSALGVSTVGKATLVLTPQTLSEFLIDSNGYPDVSMLTTNTGDSPDVNSGDPDLSTPGFAVGNQLNFGNPEGQVAALYGPPPLFMESSRGGVFVDEIQAGCVVTLKDGSGNTLAGNEVYMTSLSSVGSEPIRFFAEYGDTIFVPGSQSAIASGSFSDPPNLTQSGELARTVGDYRIQFDLKVKKRSGQFADATLPVEKDIWGLPIKEWAGQSPPTPCSTLEGEVDFANGSMAPLQLPALLGQYRDDSGDVSIPYLYLEGAEKQALAETELAFRGLYVDTEVVLPIPAFAPANEIQDWKAVYPDERYLSDGSLYVAVHSGTQEPATLYTSKDQTPVETAGVYTDHSGLGDVRKFDLILSQVGGNSLAAGATGILSVGAVAADSIEVPRFVTPTSRGGTHNYIARNLFCHVGGGGVVIDQLFMLGVYSVTLNFSSTPGIILDDGSGTGAGGLTSILASTGNVVYVDFYNPSPLAAPGTSYLGSLIIPTKNAGGTVYFRNSAGVVSSALLDTNLHLFGSTNIMFQESTVSFLTATGLSAFVPYDYSITVDTYVDAATSARTGGAVAIASAPGSVTCSVNRDRLTFDERVSFRTAKARGTRPANGDNIDLAFQLNVEVSPIGTAATPSTVNGLAETNANLPFTFVSRTYGIGKFTPATGPGAGNELGSVKLMSWEGNGNVTLGNLADVVLSPVPSSNADIDTELFEGSGIMSDDQLAPTFEPHTWIHNTNASVGGLDKVLPGDIVVVDGGATGEGAIKTGTYLVRHAISGVGNVAGSNTETKAGDRQALDLRFPVLESSNAGTFEVTLSGVPVVWYSPTQCGFESSGTLYLILDSNYVTYDSGVSEFNVDMQAILTIHYSAVSFDVDTETAVLTVDAGSAALPDGTPISDDDFFAACQTNPMCSGMVYVPFWQAEGSYPTNNLVGPDEVLGAPMVAGVRYLVAGNTSISLAPGSSVLWQAGVNLDRDLDGSVLPGAGRIGVRVPEAHDSLTVTPYAGVVVYGRDITNPGTPGGLDRTSGVATHIDLRSINLDDIHFGALATLSPPGTTLQCVLPGDRFKFSNTLDGVTAGYWAVTGIFLEPSFPRPGTNLNQAVPHVVSSSYPAGGLSEIGVRRAQDFGGGVSEDVHFYVRRIRRWHAAQEELSYVLSPLRYVYEMRVGVFDPMTVIPASSVTIVTGTNLGYFDDTKVGIHAGDLFQVFDRDGLILDSAEIRRIDSSTTVSFYSPGLTKDLSSAVGFRVMLTQPAVPHEQSGEQLLDILTDALLKQVTVDYASPPGTEGGTVANANEFTDPSVLDWTLLGISEGDYLIVDPAGQLYAEGEKGQGPIGDQSVSQRLSPTWVPGSPAYLDDNRGFYRITGIEASHLTVTGVSRFCGDAIDGSDNVVFGDADAEYAVLPTVSNSALTGDNEGQQTLRPTAASVGGSFLDRTGLDLYKSVQPFSYRIVRVDSRFSRNATELILFMRERMLSWIQEIQDAYTVQRDGDYREFQLEDQIEDLPNSSNRTRGLGYWSNALIDSLRGVVNVAPFANVDDCLSVLDRRVWIKDLKLDYTYPPSGGPDAYTDLGTNSLNQAPVLTDYIADALDLQDGFRQTRYAWIRFRADRVDGSIVNALRARDQLPDRLRRERELVALRRS